MKRVRIFTALLACLAASTVNADSWNKKTKVTFSGPVQVPGAQAKSGVVTLPAGTYVFRLLNSDSDRHIVEVTNERQDKVYTSILAINDYRLSASSKTVMYFSERKAGAPVAIKSWFYPGDNFGQRFVYPKVQAAQIAATVNQPVPSHTVEVVETTKYVAIPVYIQTPEKKEVAYSAATFTKADSTDTAGDDGEAVKAPAAAPLPKTASSLPAVGLLGLLLLAVSILVRRAAFQLR
jgi:hypothetical protein